TVGRVAPQSIVMRVGLREWDRIQTLDGHPASTMRQLATAVDHVVRDSDKRSDDVPLSVTRQGTRVDLRLPRREAAKFAEELDWNTGTVIGRVFLGLPAYQAGLREGDEILSVDGARVENWTDLSTHIRKSPETPLLLTVRRGDKVFPVTVKTTTDSVIGI